MEQTDLAKSKRPAIIAVVIIIAVLSITLTLLIISSSSKKSDISQQRQELIKEKIPYGTKEFSIVYSQKKDQIYINVLKQPYEGNRQKALDWLKQNGYDPQKLNIEYTPRNVFK